MAYQLKCKALALGAEAREFKKQERHCLDRAKKWEARAKIGRAKAERAAQYGIREHRLMAVRTEARRNNLAYGFLLGRKYEQIERFSWTQPNWDKVLASAITYSGEPEQVTRQKFAEWIGEALNGVEPKFSKTLVPGSVKNDEYDPDWVNMQIRRDAAQMASIGVPATV